jgi:hypothetical protein
MITQLIHDIAFDNIKLSQALTRSKIVENKINNDNFKQWLKKELEGYKFNDILLPEYRRFLSPMYLTAEFSFGKTHRFPVIPPDSWEKEIVDTMNFLRVVEPISIVEEHIASFEGVKGYIQIAPQHVELLGTLYKDQIEHQGGVIRTGSREIGKASYQSIIELTKQSLLDTLMELEKEFPNLINDYKMTEDNDEKVQNIITNNIYGGNNPMNIAAGQNVEQNGNTITLSTTGIEQLKKLGVEDKHIEELQNIVAENSTDKVSLKAKAMKWLGTVITSITARGLYDSIPKISAFVTSLI